MVGLCYGRCGERLALSPFGVVSLAIVVAHASDEGLDLLQRERAEVCGGELILVGYGTLPWLRDAEKGRLSVLLRQLGQSVKTPSRRANSSLPPCPLSPACLRQGLSDGS